MRIYVRLCHFTKQIKQCQKLTETVSIGEWANYRIIPLLSKHIHILNGK